MFRNSVWIYVNIEKNFSKKYFKKVLTNMRSVWHNKNTKETKRFTTKGEERLRQKNLELMEKIKSFTEQYALINRRSPSLKEIADGVNSSKATVYRYLYEMNARGIVQYSGKDGILTERMEKFKNDPSIVAVLGNVSCGIPKYAEENIEAYIELPRQLLGDGMFYILRAKGDSMINAGIDDGDFVLIRQQCTAENGDIVVALIEDEATLKRYYIGEDGKLIRLHPENPEYNDIFTDNVIIQGVAAMVFKDLKKRI